MLRCTKIREPATEGIPSIVGSENTNLLIGIGGHLAMPPLPHHRTYGSVYGGSADYATGTAATEGRPSNLRTALERAMFSAGLLLSRQGPCGAPAVCAAKSPQAAQTSGA